LSRQQKLSGQDADTLRRLVCLPPRRLLYSEGPCFGLFALAFCDCELWFGYHTAISPSLHPLPQRKMSCCGGNCSCGSGCTCGSGSGGCMMFPDLVSAEKSTTTETLILGVAPAEKRSFEGSGMGTGVSENGCKCGPNCACNPCTCK
ncbi:hypothetical protein Taro_025661, partial [Colocasia esculenta]|nr:hypothetical protein [Colocasia esculenta]